jgi:hypothetical protein
VEAVAVTPVLGDNVHGPGPGTTSETGPGSHVSGRSDQQQSDNTTVSYEADPDLNTEVDIPTQPSQQVFFSTQTRKGNSVASRRSMSDRTARSVKSTKSEPTGPTFKTRGRPIKPHEVLQCVYVGYLGTQDS